MVTWKDHIPANQKCNQYISLIDFIPTFSALVGEPLPNQPIDGVSLLPLMEGKEKIDRPNGMFWFVPIYLKGWKDNMPYNIYGTTQPYWRVVPSVVHLKGNYKMFYMFEDNSIRLYNLANDPGERENLNKKESAITKQMKQEILAWLKETNAPIPNIQNDKFNNSGNINEEVK